MKSDSGAQRFLPDANLFVAAIKIPGRETGTHRLLLKLLSDPAIELVGDEFLMAEFNRAAAAFRSPTGAALLHSIAEHIVLVEPEERFIAACLTFMGEANLADVVHASVCLKAPATLISNDRDFDAIVKAGLIKRMTLTEAVRALL